MDHSDYNNWAKTKVDELIRLKIKKENDYDIEVIREYLVFSQNSKTGKVLFEFFKENNNDDNLFKVILEILLDESEDYSNDARYSAAKIIPLFNVEIVKRYKKELRYVQSYELKNLRPFSKDNYPSWLYEE
jgi:ribosomal protein S3AE